jgi:hypothetical protein
MHRLLHRGWRLPFHSDSRARPTQNGVTRNPVPSPLGARPPDTQDTMKYY